MDQVRAKYPSIQVIVHPECRWEVCQKADALGSTERLIEIVEDAPAGSMFAIGTEIHLVNRLAKRFATEGKTDYHIGRYGLPVHDDVPQHPARSTWPGHWKTWWRDAWWNRIAVREGREAVGEGGAGSDAGDLNRVRRSGVRGS